MSNVGSRGKPGENRRPRPSDRTLIQERARELRELVPNGTEVRFLGFCAFFISDLIHVFFLFSKCVLVVDFAFSVGFINASCLI